jgi:hypothetical protein
LSPHTGVADHDVEPVREPVDLRDHRAVTVLVCRCERDNVYHIWMCPLRQRLQCGGTGGLPRLGEAEEVGIGAGDERFHEHESTPCAR